MKVAAISFTERGKKFILISCSIVAVGILFIDYFIIAFGIALLAYATYSLFDARRLLNEHAEAGLGSPRYLTTAGAPVELELYTNGLAGWKGSIKEAPEFGDFMLAGDSIKISGTITLASLRQLKNLSVTRRSYYELYEARKIIALEPPAEILAYPRFVVPLYRLFGYEELGEFNEPSVARISVASTGEYAGTRNYYPGDEPRFIDWKATARSQELKLKEFTSENAGSFNLVLDTTSTDAVSADLLATQFLGSMVDLLDRGARVNVAFYDGLKYQLVKPRHVYSETAEAVLSMTGKYFPEIGRIIDLPVRRWSVPELENEPANEPVQGIPESGRTIVVSQLLSDITDDLARNPDTIEVVLQPTRPWLHIESLEDAYLAKNRVTRNVESLRRAGVKVIEADSPVEPPLASVALLNR